MSTVGNACPRRRCGGLLGPHCETKQCHWWVCTKCGFWGDPQVPAKWIEPLSGGRREV